MASQNSGNTIYLTEQEAERIRNTVKDRLQKCSEQSGNAHEARDKLAAHQQATGAALMADMGGGAPDPDLADTKGGKGDTIPVLAVGQPYPPCTALSEDLEPMKMADLKMETHHRGRKLLVKRPSPVVTLAARSWTMVQDEEGDDTERLEICLHKSRYGEEILEFSKNFVIKEPYFTLTDQGEPTIRIDHPSDLIVRYDSVQEKETDNSEQAAKIATRYKTQGNTALKEPDLPLAHAKYTGGLEIASRKPLAEANPDLARDISRNRAYVNLLLERLDEAITDAQASLTGREDERSKDLDSKAYYRAACAAYSLGKFTEAKQLFECQQKLSPSDKDAKVYLKKLEQRRTEQETGVYDLMKLRSGLSRARPRADAANFKSNTQIKNSPGRGRGLFATRNMSSGEIIMCEKAFCVVWGHDREALTAMTYDVRDDKIRFSPVGLTKAIVQKLLNNPSQIESVMALTDGHNADNKSMNTNANGAIVDVFRIHDIMSHNAFGLGSQYGEEGARNASTGLWIHASYINHSCIFNAKKEDTGDMMVLRATRPIKSGEEIFHSYNDSLDYDARQQVLQTTWGFECDCALCAAEKADGKAVRDKRMELVGEADAFVERTPWAGAKRLAPRKAQRLLQAINETYDAQRYEGLPRRHDENIRAWLAKASAR